MIVMSNWPVNAATRSENLGFSAGNGTPLTPGNGSKGAYATIGTTSFQYTGFSFYFTSGGANAKFRIDIAINTGGSDVTIVEDFYVDVASTTGNGLAFFIPVKIPAGAVVKACAQSTISTSSALFVSLTGFAQDTPATPPSSKVILCTDATAVLPTNSVAQNGTTFTAWTVICASTAARVKELFLCATGGADVSRVSAAMIIEIAIGTAGNEQTIGAFLTKQTSANLIPTFARLLCDIPAGTRIAFRCQTNDVTTTDTVHVWANGVLA